MSIFFFNDTATTEIYTLSLHDALPISEVGLPQVRPEHLVLDVLGPDAPLDQGAAHRLHERQRTAQVVRRPDRKSTRLNSSHANISYAVFCLKKKNNRLESRDRLTGSRR